MKSKEQIMLINGIFSDIDAKEILQNVIRTKIQFHSMKIFSTHERLGKDDETSKKRIQDLNHDLEKINKLISFAQTNHKLLKIHSTIQITLQ